MGSSEMYQEAYSEHYKKKNYEKALNGYLKVIGLFSESSEARYALQQINNLKTMPVFEDFEIEGDNYATYKQIMNAEEEKNQKKILREANEVAKRQRKEELNQLMNELILTTCPSVDGYVITEHKGLVFGEVVMKMGFIKSLGASIDNLTAVFSFGDNELLGTSNLMGDAREYAIKKMSVDAVQRGANAIVGIDSESSMGGDIMKISIMGTAVKIEKSN